MKKVLFTLIMSFIIGGSVFAQETHWPGFDYHDFMFSKALIANIQIDGSYITEEMDYENIEICPFVGEEQRGYNCFIVFYEGDPYPIVESSIFYTDPGETVTFKMFDHANGIEYDICTTIPETILTGVDNGDYDNPVILNFTKSFTKDIAAYTEGQKDHYYLIASPIGTVSAENIESVTNMLSNSYDLYRFNQNPEVVNGIGLEWENYKAGSFSLVPGEGYLYANSGDGQNDVFTLTFTGAPYNESGEVTLAKVDGAEWSGWNLVGNPFGQTAYVTKLYYVMNGDGTAIVASERNDNHVDVMEGIFVEAESDGETMTFTTTQPTKNNEQIVLNVTRNNRGAAIDRAIVRFNQENGLPKFQLNPNHTKVYIPQNGKDYAVVNAETQGEMPVNFKADKNGNYTFSVTAEEVDVNYLHLIDNLTGADVDLKATPSYTFEAHTTDYPSRFKLVFAVDRATEESFAFFNNGNWVINNDGKAVLQVIDINGRILSNEQISGNVSKRIEAAPGVYVMRLINGNDVKVQKIIIK